MLKRDIQILVRLSPEENRKLKDNVRETGLSQEAYIRSLINGLQPVKSPPVDFYSMMDQLYMVGNNLNQIAKKAHVLNVIDVRKYDEAIKSYNDIITILSEAFVPKEKE